jgi:hypothetical protein
MASNIPAEQFATGAVVNGRRLPLVSTQSVFDYIEAYLAEHPYFGGSEFSTADIMMQFSVNSAKLTAGFDTRNFRRVQEWRAKVEARPAFARAQAAAVPGGCDEYGLPLGMPLPFAESTAPAPMPSPLVQALG